MPMDSAASEMGLDVKRNRAVYVALFAFIAFLLWKEYSGLDEYDEDTFLLPNTQVARTAAPIIDESSGRQVVFQTYRYTPQAI